MSIISEKVSYLRGLMDGMKFDTETNEGKLFSEIINVLDSIAYDMEAIEDAQDELFDAVYELEDDVDELYECCDGDCDCCDDECDCCGDDEEFVICCPACGESFYIYEEDLMEEEPIECPSCGQVIDLEIECDEDFDEE